jgi:hypothetical protein
MSRVLQNPFEEQKEFSSYQLAPGPGETVQATFCGPSEVFSLNTGIVNFPQVVLNGLGWTMVHASAVIMGVYDYCIRYCIWHYFHRLLSLTYTSSMYRHLHS